MTALAPEPLVTRDTADAEVHVVCCDLDVALCGTDVADSAWVDDAEEATCVVCRELEGRTCPRCGS